MNNPNPFVPKGSLLEQQNKRRTHMKLGVYCVLGVSVVGLMGMLIQGCKQKSPDTDITQPDTNAPAMPDTNAPAAPDTNAPAIPPTNTTAVTPVQPAVPQPPVAIQPLPPVAPDVTGGSEYTVVKGDSLAKIAKKNGVTLKALEGANPTVKPTKLKIGEKLTIPAGGKPAADTTVAGAAAPTADTGGESYTVKSGDTLTKIARAQGVKLKALQAANGLTTTKIKVGQKLTIPAKAESAAAPAAPAAPAPDTTAPVAPVPAVPAPQPVTPAAPAHN